MTRCAYPRCQAGGDILEGAPAVVDATALVLDGTLVEYHHGCWAALDAGLEEFKRSAATVAQ